MTRKIIRYLLLVIVIALLGYNSVYIKKLSAMKDTGPVAFNAAAFAQKLWENQLPGRLDSAITLDTLSAALHANAEQAFASHCNALDIGNMRYCLVKLSGKVTAVNDDAVVLLVNNGGTPLSIKIATEYVYGNAVRDASGLVNIKDFVNTMDLNNISEELDKKIRLSVLPPFKATVKKADSVACTGAISLNKAHYSFNDLEIIPVQLKIIQQ